MGEPVKMTEAVLCAEFTARARVSGWEVYAETGGWDLLLVWLGTAACDSLDDSPPDLSPGDQWGIQAKLRASYAVLEQALPPYRATRQAPNFRGVLIPAVPSGFMRVCDALRLTVATPHAGPVMAPLWRWPSADRHTLPPIVPTFAGGHPSPSKLSPWRVGALRLMSRLRAGETVMRSDFRRAGIDHRRFETCRWVMRHGPLVKVPGGSDAGYVLHPDPSDGGRLGIHPLPDVGYEAERDALAALEVAS